MAIAPMVDISQLNPLVEIIVRAGNVTTQQARTVLQANYRVEDRTHQSQSGQNLRGLSVVFHIGATYQILIQRNTLPHPKISYATVAVIQTALARAGYDFRLYNTPSAKLPDHHLLVVVQHQQELLDLPDDAADALIAVLQVITNPNPRQP